jgi:hypothetical protein
MTISYPVSIPVNNIARLEISSHSVVGVSVSPFTSEQQVYAHQGGHWKGRVELPPMKRENAEQWIAALLALNGQEGTILIGDPVNVSPRVTWAGTPVVHGASQSGYSLNVDGFTPYATGKAGDWMQLSSGSTTRLHKVTQDFTADSGGEANVCIWPRLREAPSDNGAIVTSSPKGRWRLAQSGISWSLEPSDLYGGFSFTITEAL